MLKVFQHHISVWMLIQLLADGVVCMAAILVAGQQVLGASHAPLQPASELVLPAFAFALVMSLLYSAMGNYRRVELTVGWATTIRRALMAVAIGTLIAFLALRAEGDKDYALDLLGRAALYVAFGAIVVRSLVYFACDASIGARRVLIVGSGPEAQRVASDLKSGARPQPWLVGFYPTGDEAAIGVSNTRVFDRGLSIEQVVEKYRIDEVIVAAAERRGGSVPIDQLLACRIRGIPVLDLAGFYERTKGEVPTNSLRASWLIYGNGFAQGHWRRFIKRTFDIVSSSILLVVASPVMVLTAIAIRLESAGPVIYRQERVGLGGRGFMCMKFRSMRDDAEQDGIARWATVNDPRITTVGAFIRKTRIDELPQLISVLRGEMSMVGPRPERPCFVAQLKEQLPYYDIRHSVKPGITGWAQVRYRYGASVEDARKKHQFDLYYVKNNSLLLDLLVLVETVSVVLFREGAH
jgi:sugar transferase (PEP-CTERM system associated)